MSNRGPIDSQFNEKMDFNKPNIEINNFFSDNKQVDVQINLKDGIRQNVIKRERKTMMNRRYGLEIMDKLNHTQNEPLKNYKGVNSSQDNQGSKTQRKDLSNRIIIYNKMKQILE